MLSASLSRAGVSWWSRFDAWILETIYFAMDVTAATTQSITAALRNAGQRTGISFDYLLQTAKRESSLNANAEASTSSAAGLFQFIEQTWLGAVKAYGARHGLGSYSAEIIRGDNGQLHVQDDDRRAAILNLRFDPEASAAMAGELAQENKSFLEKRLGRVAGAADLYAAHFLGPSGAVKLLTSAANQPAASLLPGAANANQAVFYDGARAKTVGEVIASIASSMGEGGGAVPVEPNNTLSVAPQQTFSAGRAPRAVSARSDKVIVDASRPFTFNNLGTDILRLLDLSSLLRSRDKDDAQ